MRKIRIALALGAALLATAAQATVYLNGVNVDGASLSQKFDRCTVTFDGKGNVLIEAPGFAVESIAAGPTAVAPGVLAKKYFVVSEQSMPGLTQYDIDLYVNSKWVRKFRSDDDQVVTDVTQYFHPGPNKIVFVAKKVVIGARKSFTPAATYQITLGTGNATGDKVVIDDPLVVFKRTAAQTDDVTQDFNIDGH